MSNIPSVTFHIMGPNEGVAEGSHQGLWFKLQSDPPPASNLIVGVKVSTLSGRVLQSGTVMILKNESHSADLFYKMVKYKMRNYNGICLEIEPFESLSELEFPIFTNEGYMIEAGHTFLEYSIGSPSKILPYVSGQPVKGVWTDEKL